MIAAVFAKLKFQSVSVFHQQKQNGQRILYTCYSMDNWKLLTFAYGQKHTVKSGTIKTGKAVRLDS